MIDSDTTRDVLEMHVIRAVKTEGAVKTEDGTFIDPGRYVVLDWYGNLIVYRRSTETEPRTAVLAPDLMHLIYTGPASLPVLIIG